MLHQIEQSHWKTNNRFCHNRSWPVKWLTSCFNDRSTFGSTNAETISAPFTVRPVTPRPQDKVPRILTTDYPEIMDFSKLRAKEAVQLWPLLLLLHSCLISLLFAKGFSGSALVGVVALESGFKKVLV